MRTVDLVRQIERAAQTGTPRKTCEVAREDAAFSVLRCGTTSFTVPREPETNDHTARAVRRFLERELGEQWWL